MLSHLVKVCCISSLDEGRVALNLGADLLGLVSEMPSGPGVISLELIAEIVTSLPEDTRSVLLTSKTKSDDIIQQHLKVRTWGLQLVDSVSAGELAKLRYQLPETQLIQVVHVQGRQSIDEALKIAGLVDFLLLDSGSPGAKIKTLGGTGLTHDWKLSHEICNQSPVPVLLAGGLSPENVSGAIQEVQPAGVDLCSGVRTDGHLDAQKLALFMRMVKQGYKQLE